MTNINVDFLFSKSKPVIGETTAPASPEKDNKAFAMLMGRELGTDAGNLGGRQAKPLMQVGRQVWDSSASGNGRADLAQGGEAVLSELRGVFSNVSGKPVSEEDILNLLAQSGIPTADLDCLVQGDNMEKLAEDLADVIMEHDVASDSLPEGDAVSDVEEPSLLEDEMKSGGNKVRDYMKSLFDSLRRFVNPGEIAESDLQAGSGIAGQTAAPLGSEGKATGAELPVAADNSEKARSFPGQDGEESAVNGNTMPVSGKVFLSASGSGADQTYTVQKQGDGNGSDVQARSEQSGRAVYHTEFDDSSPVTAGKGDVPPLREAHEEGQGRDQAQPGVAARIHENARANGGQLQDADVKLDVNGGEGQRTGSVSQGRDVSSEDTRFINPPDADRRLEGQTVDGVGRSSRIAVNAADKSEDKLSLQELQAREAQNKINARGADQRSGVTTAENQSGDIQKSAGAARQARDINAWQTGGLQGKTDVSSGEKDVRLAAGSGQDVAVPEKQGAGAQTAAGFTAGLNTEHADKEVAQRYAGDNVTLPRQTAGTISTAVESGSTVRITAQRDSGGLQESVTAVDADGVLKNTVRTEGVTPISGASVFETASPGTLAGRIDSGTTQKAPVEESAFPNAELVDNAESAKAGGNNVAAESGISGEMTTRGLVRDERRGGRNSSDRDAGDQVLSEVMAGKASKPDAASATGLSEARFASTMDRVERLNDLADRLDKHVLDLISSNNKSMIIRLVPANLGRIELRCSNDNGSLQVQAFVENSNVRDLLSNQVNSLKDIIQNAGFRLDQFDVRTHDDGRGARDKRFEKESDDPLGRLADEGFRPEQPAAPAPSMNETRGRDNVWYVA